MTLETEVGNWIKIFDVPLLYKTLNNIPTENICPAKENVFRAFKLCPLENCKVVFLGQDPYPQKGVATGILFGNKGNSISPSLQVLKEAVIDYTIYHNLPIIFDNSLENWASQGILMLNSALTVKTNEIGSHTQVWRPFISKFLKTLSNYQSCVYVLFGEQAKTFKPYINSRYNYILEEKHPAFYARTNQTMPNTVFKEVNDYLKAQYKDTIVWYTEGSEDIDYAE